MHALAGDACDPEFTRALLEAADEIDRMHAMRLKLDRRIHNQRLCNRENWEIVEMRRKWMGTPAHYTRMQFWIGKYREAKKELELSRGVGQSTTEPK